MRYLSTNEVSDILNISGNQVRYLIRNGRLVASKELGKEFQVHTVDAARFKVLNDMYIRQDPGEPDIVWVFEASKYLVDLVKKSSFVPRQLVAVAMGGLVPAAIVASLLRIPMYIIELSHYEGRERKEEITVTYKPSDIKDVPTLVVDDIVDTGETLKVVVNELVEVGVSTDNIKVGVLHKKPGACFEPDWYVYLTKDWVVYPWER